jgi:hypothetical protein
MTEPQAAHLRLMADLSHRVRTVPAKHRIAQDFKAWNPSVRPNSVPGKVYEAFRKAGELTNKQLEAMDLGERKNLIVALYALRKKKLIAGIGTEPYAKHRLIGERSAGGDFE